MTLGELLSLLRGRRIRLWVEGDRVRYQAPPDSMTSELRSQLHEFEEEIVRRVRRDHLLAAEGVPITSAPTRSVYPASFNQQQMWVQEFFTTGGPRLKHTGVLTYGHEVDVPALQSAFDSMLRHHTLLRTTIDLENGSLVQRVSPWRPFKLRRRTTTGWAEDQVPAIPYWIADELSNAPFDYSADPPVQAELIRLGDADWALVISFHHIAFDEWSIAAFVREVGQLYSDLRKGQDPQLSFSSIQFGDVAAWQREYLEHGELNSQIAYWRVQLENLPQLLPLPSDRPRPAVQVPRGATQSLIALDPDNVSVLRGLSSTESVPPYVIFLAACKALLYRYTGQRDVAVGGYMTNRGRPETARLIGDLRNTVVLRTPVHGSMTFRELIRDVRATVFQASEHQEVALGHLENELRPVRDPSHRPLYQATVGYHRGGVGVAPPASVKSSAGGQEVLESVVAEPLQGSYFLDLNLVAYELPEGLRIKVNYNDTLFDHESMRQMLGSLRRLIIAATESPDQRISDISLVPIADLSVHSPSRDNRSRPQGQPISDWDPCRLVEARSRERPDAIALRSGDEHMSYRELNKRANKLASYLRRLGVEPEIITAVLLEHGIDQVISLLGVLKTGGACAVIGSWVSEERRECWLNNVAPNVAVTSGLLADQLEDSIPRLVRLDEDSDRIQAEADTSPSVQVHGYNAAVVSSSPEIDSHLLITQSSLRRTIKRLHSLGLLAEDTVVRTDEPRGFTDLVRSTIWPLTAGAQLTIGSTDTWGDLWPDQRAGAVDLTEQGDPGSVQVVSRPDRSRRDLPRKELMVDCVEPRLHMTRRIAAASRLGVRTFFQSPETGIIAISGVSRFLGRPTINPTEVGDDAGIYVLDLDLKPLPKGVYGELWASSSTLARGYLRGNYATACSMVPDPFCDSPGGRMVRTRNVARVLRDGSVEIAGRIENRVDINGYLVQLEDVASVACTHPMVKSISISPANASGPHRSVVCLIRDSEDPAACPGLDDFLRPRLPNFMTQAVLKIRTSEVTDPPVPRLAEDSATIQPVAQTTTASPLEHEVGRSVASVLGIGQVGLNETFLELGGDSLSAVALVTRLEERLDVRLAVNLLYRSPSVARLASTIRALYPGSTGE